MEPKPRRVASLPWQSCLGSKDWEMKLAFLQLRGFETCCPVLHIYGKRHTMFVWWYLTSSAWTYWKMMSRLLCPAYRSFHLPNDDKEPKGPGGGLCSLADGQCFYFLFYFFGQWWSTAVVRTFWSVLSSYLFHVWLPRVHHPCIGSH